MQNNISQRICEDSCELSFHFHLVLDSIFPCLFVCLFFSRQSSLCSSGASLGTHYLDYTGLELRVHPTTTWNIDMDYHPAFSRKRNLVFYILV